MIESKPIDIGLQCIWNEAPIIRGWAKTMLYFCKKVYALLDPNTNDGTEKILRKEFPEIEIIYQDLSLGDSNDYIGKGKEGKMTTHMNVNYYLPKLAKEGQWILYLAADERFRPEHWKRLADEIQYAKKMNRKGLVHYKFYEFYFNNKTCANLINSDGRSYANKVRFIQYDKRWKHIAGSHTGREWRPDNADLLESIVPLYHYGRILPHKPAFNWRYFVETADWIRFGGPEGKFPMKEYEGEPFDNWMKLD